MVVFSLFFPYVSVSTRKDLLAVNWEEYYEYQITFNGIISNYFKQQVEPRALKGQISQ